MNFLEKFLIKGLLVLIVIQSIHVEGDNPLRCFSSKECDIKCKDEIKLDGIIASCRNGVCLCVSLGARRRRQADMNEILQTLSNNPRDELAKMVLEKNGEKIEGSKQLDYLNKIDNYLGSIGENVDSDTITLAKQKAGIGRLRIG